jgi:hypothetical protein
LSLVRAGLGWFNAQLLVFLSSAWAWALLDYSNSVSGEWSRVRSSFFRSLAFFPTDPSWLVSSDCSIFVAFCITFLSKLTILKPKFGSIFCFLEMKSLRAA